MWHPASGDRGGPDHRSGGLVQAVQADQQQAGQIVRQPTDARFGRTHQLLGEECIALGPADDAVDDRLGRWFRMQVAHQAADIGVGQRRQQHPVHLAQPRPLRERRSERMPPVQVVGAVGHHDADGHVEPAGEQQAQHVLGGPVGPVSVLDDEEHRACGTQVGQRGMHVVEQIATADRRRGGVGGPEGQPGGGGMLLGEPPGGLWVLGGQPGEHLGEREIGRRRVPEVDAVTHHYSHAVGSRR